MQKGFNNPPNKAQLSIRNHADISIRLKESFNAGKYNPIN